MCNMNQDPPQDPPVNSKPKKVDPRRRLFGAAIQGIRKDKHKLPQPNYDTDLSRTGPFRKQRSNLPIRRNDSYVDAKRSGNNFTSSGTSYQHEAHPRNNYQRPHWRSDSSKNKYNQAGDHPFENSATQPVRVDRTMRSSSLNDSLLSYNKRSYISDKNYNHNVSNDPVLEVLPSLNSPYLSTTNVSSFSNSLKPSDEIIPAQLLGENEPSIAPPIPCNNPPKEAFGFPDNSSDYESWEDSSVCSSNFSYHPSDDLTVVSCFGSIPPPTPPRKPNRVGLLGGTVSFNGNCSHEQQIENITVVLPVSATGDLCEQRSVILKYSSADSTSSSCDSVQPSTLTLSVEEQNCRTESGPSNIDNTNTLLVEDSNSDEDEDSSSSISDSRSITDVKPEQADAINNLLIMIREERASTESDRVNDVVETLILVVKKYMRGCWLKQYGSYVSGFAISTSDINIALIPDKHINSSHKILQDIIRPIQKEIPNCEPVYEGDQGYRSASVSFFEPASNICCKIRILGTNYLCQTARLLRNFGELDSRVKTLVISVRHWAEVCDIHEEENGRLHPLNYVLMMIHFLQHQHPPVLPIPDLKAPGKMKPLEENKQTVGHLWLEFFRYYAETFNWKDHVVSIISKDPVLKASKSWGKCWIAVEEPYDQYVNVAKAVVSQDVSNFIRALFSNTHKYFLHPTPPDVVETLSDQAEEPISSGGGGSENLPEFKYDFYPENFLNGLWVPVVCSTCEHLGHLCDACLYDETSLIHSLPKMTPEFLRVIDEALERMYERESISEKQLEDREGLIKKLETHLEKRLKGARVELIGSSKNGFGLNNSDVDVCFTLEGQSVEDVDAKIMVKKIKNILCKIWEFSDIIYINTSKIPIVKFIDNRKNLRCDISVYNELAVYNTRLLRAYSKIDRRVRILGCAMKMLAKKACIDDTAQRTLSSYSYILMVLYFLQQVEPPVIPVLQELYYTKLPMPEHIVEGENVWFYGDIENLDKIWDGRGKNRQSVGELWVGLLEFYTTKFDFHHFISIAQKSPLVELKNVSSSMLFNIQDPFIKNLNLGSRMSGDMSRRTLKTFQRARVLFGTPIPTGKPPSGFDSFEAYFFNTSSLTDGKVMQKIECSLCGKLGHRDNACKRYRLNTTRFWNKMPQKMK